MLIGYMYLHSTYYRFNQNISFVAGLQRLCLFWPPAHFFLVQVTHANKHTKKAELQEELI